MKLCDSEVGGGDYWAQGPNKGRSFKTLVINSLKVFEILGL